MTPHYPASRQRFAARLLALLILATLAWPAVGFCLPGGPGAMPCCAKREAGAPPTMRACCGETPASPAAPRTSTAGMLRVSQPSSAYPFVTTPSSTSIAVAFAPRVARVEIRLLHSVFLI